MIEITSPDAAGITRILVDGVERYSIVPLRMREAAQAYYGQEMEYAVYPSAAKMSGQSFHLSAGEAMSRAMDNVGKYYV